jgi:hypothetical protein
VGLPMELLETTLQDIQLHLSQKQE